MESTITQNGALYGVQHKATRKTRAQRREPNVADARKEALTLRTSVGEFAFRPARFGCYLDIMVGKVRRVLGFYETNKAAVNALENRRTGFRTWDALERKTAATQLRRLKSMQTQ